MRVQGLDAEATAELVQREAPETTPDGAVRLHRDTGGNPLALLELAREKMPDTPLDTPVPTVTSVAAAYLQRARRLPARTFDLLVLAAAYDGADLGIVTRAAETLGLAVGDLPAAEEADLITIGAAEFAFSPPAHSLGDLRRCLARAAPPRPSGAGRRSAGRRGRPAGVAPRSGRGWP